MWVEVTLAALRLLIFLLISDLLKEKTKMYWRCPKIAGGLCPCPCSVHSIMSCQAGSGSQEDAGIRQCPRHSSSDTLPPKLTACPNSGLVWACLNWFLWLQLTSTWINASIFGAWGSGCQCKFLKAFKDKGLCGSFVSFSAHHADLIFSVNGSELMVFIPSVKNKIWMLQTCQYVWKITFTCSTDYFIILTTSTAPCWHAGTAELRSAQGVWSQKLARAGFCGTFQMCSCTSHCITCRHFWTAGSSRQGQLMTTCKNDLP